MRQHWWITLTAIALSAPTVATAQPYWGPPVFAPPPPPQVYIHQRVRWHHFRHVVPGGVWVTPGPPPVWIAPQPPSPPPPPVYMAPVPPVVIQPQPPIYVQPQPIYIAPPVMNPYPVVVAAPPQQIVVAAAPPKPQFAYKIGLGATIEGLYAQSLVTEGNTKDSNSGFGVLGQLRYRAGRHIALELMGGYEKSSASSGLDRRDVPFSAGLIIPILGPEYGLTPYLVGAVGLNFADLKLLDAPTLQIDDSRTQALAQLGGGLELRLGKRFAINADLRGEWRWNLNGPSDAVKNTTSIDGKPVTPIADSAGIRVGLGGSIYF